MTRHMEVALFVILLFSLVLSLMVNESERIENTEEIERVKAGIVRMEARMIRWINTEYAWHEHYYNSRPNPYITLGVL